MQTQLTLMTSSRLARLLAAAALLLGMTTVLPRPAVAGAAPKAKPNQRVVACYFHRTVRCPTCQKVGAYIDEAIKTGCAAELKDGRLEWMMLDFQNPQNQRYVAAFRITGPTLVLMRVQNDKVVAWKPARKAWSLVGDKDALFRYVQGEIHGLLAAQPGTAPTTGGK